MFKVICLVSDKVRIINFDFIMFSRIFLLFLIFDKSVFYIVRKFF